MITLKTQTLLALLIATCLPLMHGCKELNDQKSTTSNISEISEPESTVSDPDPVFEPIQVNAAPQDLSGYPGQTATFNVTASSGIPLSYQWFHNDSAITGATHSSYSFTISSINDAGNYRVAIRNESTSESRAAELFVSSLPEIINEPDDVSVYPGGTALFQVNASGDNIEYEWQSRGLWGWSTMEETGSTLTVENVNTSTRKQYRVKVKNAGSEKVSRTTRINLKNPVAITSQPENQLVEEGDNVSFSITASGYGSLSYQWLKAGAPIADGSKFQGSRTPTLTVQNTTSADASLYQAVAVNQDGVSATSNNAQLSVRGPVMVTVHPKSATVYAGDSVDLVIGTSGDGPISYHWQKWDGASWRNLEKPSSSTLNLTNASSNAAGRYRCIVGNGVSSDASNPAEISVLKSVSISHSPGSETAEIGDSVSFTVTAEGDDLQYEWTKDGQVIPSIGASLNFASVRELDEAQYSCRVYNDGGSAKCTNFNLNVLSPVAITTQPVSQSSYEGGSVALHVEATGDPEPEITWYFNGSVAGNGNNLTLNNITPEQAGEYHCEVSNDINKVTCNTVSISVSNSVQITSQPSDTTANEGSALNLSLEAIGDNLSYEWFKDGQSLGINSTTLSIAALSENNAGTYSCRVWNDHSSLNCQNFSLTIQGQVAITQQPTGATAYEDNAIALTVEHNAGSDAQVTWYFNDLKVATNTSTLTLSPLTMDQAGQYRCVVANTVNSVACNTVTVEVLEKARITKQPSSQVLTEGDTLVFDIEASGAAPLTYRCYFGDSLLVTSNSISDLVVPAIQSTDQGQYYCTASNEGSQVTSDSLTISVISLTREILISWHAPDLRADDSTIDPEEISHYNIYTATAPEASYTLTKSTSGPELETTISGLQPGTWYFVVTTVDTSNLESRYSDVSSLEIH